MNSTSATVRVALPDPSPAPAPPMPIARTERIKVLVTVAPDGYVQVYAPDHVDVLVVEELATGCAAHELLVEKYLDQSLPWGYRPLHLPGRLRATHTLRPRTAGDELQRRLELELLRAARAIVAEQQQEPLRPVILPPKERSVCHG